ncbi:MAG: glycosyltransferase family 4 protein [Chloroflexota bacterium]
MLDDPQAPAAGGLTPWVTAAPPVPTRPAGVDLVGYVTAATGIGRVARDLILCLDSIGEDGSIVDLADSVDHLPRVDGAPKIASHRVEHDIALICANADQAFNSWRFLTPQFFEGKYSVGYWFWESPSFPAGWRDAFTYYDEIWVATGFVREAIARESTTPVIHMPVVLYREPAGQGPRLRAKLGIQSDEVLYLFAFDFASVFERKNPLAVVRAFLRAFPAGERVRLVMKSQNGHQFVEALAELRDAARDPRITVWDETVSPESVGDLMAACDVYVSLHRAEGLGLTLAEAMSHGKPVVATGWSGNMDFMTVANSVPVRFKLETLQRDAGPYSAGTEWAVPDEVHAAACMRELFEQPSWRRELGEMGRADLRSRYSTESVGRAIVARLETIRRRRR